jgi:hypothetical protein
MTTHYENPTNPSLVAQQTIESPFLSQQAFTHSEEESELEESLLVNSVFTEMPFPSVFEMENETGIADPETELMLRNERTVIV